MEYGPAIRSVSEFGIACVSLKNDNFPVPWEYSSVSSAISER
jgi:hypothetical protein